MLEIRRPVPATNVIRLRLIVLLVVGGYLIWSQRISATPSPFWMGLGVVILLWAAVVFRLLVRPVRLRLTPEGVFAQSMLFGHRFSWDALQWIDFSWQHDAALMCYVKEGSDTEVIVALTRSSVTDIGRTDALRYILDYRPDVPKANPVQVVERRISNT
ncbi:hypothetical protein ACEN2J_01840 [Pseudorhodobacter sp. W20_MBD10_FR17]|uniref:hypothetical protein n=1 Tax=Pseudorhodobacter sp. W20_MBD10_FR17 TaxID=3240266 RepID=UPI003F991E06